jgi:hypothetical protein
LVSIAKIFNKWLENKNKEWHKINRFKKKSLWSEMRLFFDFFAKKIKKQTHLAPPLFFEARSNSKFNGFYLHSTTYVLNYERKDAYFILISITFVKK